MAINDNNVKWKVQKVGSGGSSEVTAENLKGTVGISQGGTGATTASQACTNLGAVPTSEVSNAANKIPRYNSSGHLELPNGSEFWIA